jgi:DmsE family decaheme c-type cytochrome
MLHVEFRRGARCRPGVWAVLIALAVPAGAGGATPADYVGSETCLECHDGLAATWQRNVHSRLAPYQYPDAGIGCESCHGPGARHAETNEPDDILVPRAEDGGEAAEMCLVCHRTGATLDWRQSHHAEADLACSACHTMHAESVARFLLAKPQTELCYTCHLDVKAHFQQPSRHPLKEGFLVCSDCHDSHSPNYAGVQWGESSRELCLSCHAQYAGPYIFEHSPVNEDCGICHHPHGAVANHLLVQNEPFLCLNCHQPHFHTILAGMDGEDGYEWDVDPRVVDADPNYEGLSLTSHYDGFKRSMLTKCTQCHQAVHGTDLPSQSITGQGRALTR